MRPAAAICLCLMTACLGAADALQVTVGESFAVPVSTSRQVRFTNASVSSVMPQSFNWGRVAAYGNTVIVIVNPPADDHPPVGGGEFTLTTTMGMVMMGVILSDNAPDNVLEVTIVPKDSGGSGGGDTIPGSSDRVDGPQGFTSTSVLRSQAVRLDQDAAGVSSKDAAGVIERAAGFFANYRQVSVQEWWKPYTGLGGASTHVCTFPPRLASREELSLGGAIELRSSSTWTFLSAMWIFGDQARQVAQDCLRSTITEGLLSRCAQAAMGERLPDGQMSVLTNICALPYDPEARRRIGGQADRVNNDWEVLRGANRAAWKDSRSRLTSAFTLAMQYPEMDKKGQHLPPQEELFAWREHLLTALAETYHASQDRAQQVEFAENIIKDMHVTGDEGLGLPSTSEFPPIEIFVSRGYFESLRDDLRVFGQSGAGRNHNWSPCRLPSLRLAGAALLIELVMDDFDDVWPYGTTPDISVSQTQMTSNVAKEYLGDARQVAMTLDHHRDTLGAISRLARELADGIAHRGKDYRDDTPIMPGNVGFLPPRDPKVVVDTLLPLVKTVFADLLPMDHAAADQGYRARGQMVPPKVEELEDLVENQSPRSLSNVSDSVLVDLTGSNKDEHAYTSINQPKDKMAVDFSYRYLAQGINDGYDAYRDVLANIRRHTEGTRSWMDSRIALAWSLQAAEGTQEPEALQIALGQVRRDRVAAHHAYWLAREGVRRYALTMNWRYQSVLWTPLASWPPPPTDDPGVYVLGVIQVYQKGRGVLLDSWRGAALERQIAATVSYQAVMQERDFLYTAIRAIRSAASAQASHQRQPAKTLTTGTRQ